MAKELKFGLTELSMKASGRTTEHMAKVFSGTLMEISTKATG